MTSTPAFSEIRVEGSDARTFLHTQLASDVRGLAAGHWQYSAYCGADGRVQSLMMLACQDEQRFLLLLPAELGEAVLTRLQRYRLRARCTLAIGALRISAAEVPAAARWRGPALDWWVAPATLPEPLPAGLWREQIALGIPWLLSGSSDQWLPQMLALERLGAYSLRKGCYPGQEIIARTHYLGRVKRRLVRLRGAPSQALAAGTALQADGLPAAGMLLACDDAGDALAVVPESASGGLPLQACGAHGMSTLVIEGDVLETFGDVVLNEYQPAVVGA